MFKFEVVAQDKKARVGKLTTPHGIVETPNFMPVATQATVKSLDPRDIKELGIQILLANTYHLYLRPGAETIEKIGGLHKFMGWDGPILTDSGGFQIFSLGFGMEHKVGKMAKLFTGEIIDNDYETKNIVVRTKFCKIEEEGATFQSHLDGSVHFFSPEVSVETQKKLGADFVVAMDECTSPLHDYDYTKASMERSHRWETRSLKALKSKNQRLFGVIQGGPFEDLRVKSAKFVSDNDFLGVGIGGALISNLKMREILGWIHPHLNPEKPRHLLGIGTVSEIMAAVTAGVDLFDCVYPTRLARTGYLLPNIDITKAIYKDDKKWAYLHHLFKARELLGYRLATIHNLNFMMNLMAGIRTAIREKKFANLAQKWLQ